MYTPKHFESAAGWQTLLELHAFGVLISSDGEAKQKLSQDRTLAERWRVARELRERGNAALAEAMEALLPPADPPSA